MCLAAMLLAALVSTPAVAGLPVAYDADLKAFEYGTPDCSVYSQILGVGTPLAWKRKAPGVEDFNPGPNVERETGVEPATLSLGS
jgi:hypothetical protein